MCTPPVAAALDFYELRGSSNVHSLQWLQHYSSMDSGVAAMCTPPVAAALDFYELRGSSNVHSLQWLQH